MRRMTITMTATTRAICRVLEWSFIFGIFSSYQAEIFIFMEHTIDFNSDFVHLFNSLIWNNVSLNSANSVTKIFGITVKGLELAITCVRDQQATTAPARHMLETGSWNRFQFMLQWFIRFPELAEFTEFLFHLGKLQWTAWFNRKDHLWSEWIPIHKQWYGNISIKLGLSWTIYYRFRIWSKNLKHNFPKIQLHCENSRQKSGLSIIRHYSVWVSEGNQINWLQFRQ